jgi:hypothetical protein
MHREFDGYRTRINKPDLQDVGCYVALVSERLSQGGLKVVKRGIERNQLYEALVGHVSRSIQRSKLFQNPKRAADSECVIIKSIIDFEKSKNKGDDWTFADDGLKQATNDFLLIREYLNIYDGDHLKRLCDNWGSFFLSEADRVELESITEQDQRKERMYEKVKPLLRPLWLFFVALCYSLQDEDHELTATDAFWLGLIDEVIGGSPDLFPFRLLVENIPDPEPTTMPPADPAA